MNQAGPIDMHTHYLPPALVSALERRDEVPRVIQGQAGRLVEYGERMAYPLLDEMSDLELKIKVMDAAGIPFSILSVNIPGVDWFDGPDAGAVARDVNDELMAAVSAYPERFAGIATLPLQVPDTAAAELERAVAGGLKGAMIYSNVAGQSLDDPGLRVVFDTAAELDVPFLLHPTYPLSAQSVDVHAFVPVIGFLFDTTTAALRLIFDGLFNRHPDFKLILAHAGSVVPYIVGRVDYESSRIPGGLGALEEAPGEHIRRLLVDTICAWPPALELVVDLLGSDRVMFGTDHPFWEPARTSEALNDTNLGPEDRVAIDSTNAIRVFGLEP